MSASPGVSARSVAFALPFLVVLAQAAFMRAGHREPYPALAMPAFAGTGTAPDGSIPVESLDITARFDDGGEALVRLDALLAPMPRMTMMPASQAALRTLDRASGEMAQWLRARMTTLYPRKRATRLEVRWYRDTYRLQDGDLRRVAHEQVGASHVDFEP